MFAALFARFVGGEAAKSLARPLIYLGAALALAGAVLLVVQWDEARFAALREDHARAVALAISERDSHWRSEIERGNREALERQVHREQEAARASAAADATISALQQSLAEIEARNAALPNANRVGLSRDRVRLLRDGLKSRPPNPDSGTPPIRPFILEGAVRGPGSPP